MLTLPKPYPDEIIGSIFTRACFRTGLSMKTLIGQVHGITQSSTSFLMASNIRRVATLCGMDSEELLFQHTMFPYAVAYMPPSVQIKALDKVLQVAKDGVSISSLTKNISHGVPYRRLCRECVRQDLQRYGESYWHRAHQLPAVHVCATHGIRLRITTLPLKRRTGRNSVTLPHKLSTESGRIRMDVDILNSLTEKSIEALHQTSPSTSNWQIRFRDRALQLGYQLSTVAVATKKLSQDVFQFYGSNFLEDAGCDFLAERAGAWPGLAVRPNTFTNLATPKYVLMQTFLEFSQETERSFNYSAPGKKVRDYEELDKLTAERIERILHQHKGLDTRFTVEELLTAAGVWSAFRHQNTLFPVTHALIMRFRASNQSARQIGRRPCWRKT
ncbi:MAG: TniQ family protein [Proteobacteria bacterium]|nr:TniQ family protein [Pseudomonadota bacterium]